mmetsp:Transcript_25299/g.31176  ORF Transcript_25299/g.31176 Transcript_25299/m.31176 type:complete len:334 (+) Transcript_25299:248-1249(+)
MKSTVTGPILLMLLQQSNPFTITPQTHTPAHRLSKLCQMKSNYEGEEGGRGIKYGKKLRTFGQVVLERSDTLRSAGFYDKSSSTCTSTSSEQQPDSDFHEPLQAGAKTNITLFMLALGYKWYRSIFINKMAIWERQPQWNTVITSKEDEEKAKLEALTCNNCGATIFIAKGRKWFQMPRGYECYCCGASGNENFENTREDLLEEIDDDYFDYEKPLDFVTAAEKRKLMKEAGGDEQKAMELLTQRTKEEGDGAAAEDGSSEDAPKKKKKKKGKKKKKKKAAASSEDTLSTPVAEDQLIAEDETLSTPVAEDQPKAGSTKKTSDDDDLDVLGMD